jgi:predicted KAP-like P-loop ATPase
MSDKSKQKNKEESSNAHNNGFWTEWFKNSEEALERDKKTVRKVLDDAQKINPEDILTGRVKS